MPEDSANQSNNMITGDYQAIYDKALSGVEPDSSEPLESDNCSERYSEWKLIGSGGMKNVYRVYDHKTNRYVALAMLAHPENEEMRELFIREARLIALLNHPGIITLHDIGCDEEETPYFTMELKSDDTLKTVIQNAMDGDETYQNKYTLVYRMEIFSRICDAIAFAHSRNIIHLDLKPANVQFGDFGEVQVCDWGLGKVVDACDSLKFSEDDSMYDLIADVTVFGQVKGTPGFMAPEQIENGLKDQRTDIYALGGILYSLLTGRNPIDGGTDTVFAKTLSGEVITPDSRFPTLNIPTSLASVAMKALNVDPAKRYQSVVELNDDIKSYLSGFATSAEQAGLRTQLKLFYQRNKAVCNVAVIAVISLFCGSAVFISQLNQSRLIALDNERKSHLANAQLTKTLAMFQKEQKLNQILLTNDPGLVMELSYGFTDSKVFIDPVNSLNDAINILTRSIDANPENKLLYAQRGYARMILQQFDKACEDFEVNSDGFEDLYDLCQKYADGKRDGDVASAEDMNSLLMSLGQSLVLHYERLAIKMLCVDKFKRDSLEDHLLLVKRMVRNWNQSWDMNSDIFEYKPEHGGLFRLGGENINKLEVKHTSGRLSQQFSNKSFNVLSTLPIRRLELIGTSIRSLNELKSHGFEIIDIRGTHIKDLNHIELLTSLKHLIVADNQFTADQLSKLSKGITVEILPK